ncbi:dipeptidase PepV [Caldisalinibacter kiritimatiensis]|uniref:Acetylornithine deacetylase n=1 Tax=Caldisalinibacter kiritimatiensis TaxID=1304284 RepID=R1CF39_9FIRM|nr:dipeptidase PepV [Caldisalinibacter kiritimatiensis]EOD00915.1 Acetylornithine deacetylase [Caldisalinibacter kiritimatiensis]
MKLESLVESYKNEIVESVKKIVRIKSVEGQSRPGMPFGEGVNEALEYALKLSEKLGFKTKNFEGYAGHAEFGEGDKTIGILVHLDVVPEGDNWTYPPYGAEIHDGKIFGRGTIDDKGPAIAAMYAMKAVKESGLPINNKIRIIFGTNEESGWKGINYYLSKVDAPDLAFTPDADFPVIHGEKGIVDIVLKKKFNNKCNDDIIIKSIKGGNRPNMVPDLCRAVIEVSDDKKDNVLNTFEQFIKNTGYNIDLEDNGNTLIVVSKGKSAHGSTPEEGKNAISQLMKFLNEIVSGECEICEFIKFYNDKIGMEYNGESIGCGLEDDVSGKLTFNVGVIDLSEDKVEVAVNIRYPIKHDKETIYNGIKEVISEMGIKIEEKDHLAPIYLPENHFLVEKLMKVYREVTGDNESKPITIGGGTYARAMDNAVAFGALMPGQEELAHQKDEYISIEHLMDITKIYAKALYELVK